jgi:uncharacterized MnhB-related membrane protein
MDIKAINSAIVTGSFTAMELDAISDAVKFARARVAQSLSFTLQRGSKVTLTHAKLGGTVTGTVLKVKIKKADVKLDSGMTYTVPLSMLTPA